MPSAIACSCVTSVLQLQYGKEATYKPSPVARGETLTRRTGKEAGCYPGRYCRDGYSSVCQVGRRQGGWGCAMTCGIYSITNTKNKKRYIGSAVNIEKRWRGHRNALNRGNHHSRHLQAAWSKYGERVFVFGIVTTCDSEQLVMQEQFWIDAFQTADGKHGYNIAPKAGSSLGIKRSAETRAKVSAALRQRIDSDETRTKKSASRRGLKHSMETRAKMAESARHANARPEVKAKISAALKGIERSIETRAKASAAMRAAWGRPEIREKMAAINVGRKHTGQARENIAAAARRNLARPEVRAKIGAALREAQARPEVKAKMIAAKTGVKQSADTIAKRAVSLRKVWANPETKAKISGINHHRAALTDSDVIRIRELLADGMPQTEIGRIFGVSYTCVYSIKIGRTWSHVK